MINFQVFERRPKLKGFRVSCPRSISGDCTLVGPSPCATSTGRCTVLDIAHSLALLHARRALELRSFGYVASWFCLMQSLLRAIVDLRRYGDCFGWSWYISYSVQCVLSN